MKVIANVGYFGPTFSVSSSVLRDFYEEPEYNCEITKNIIKRSFGSSFRYEFISRTMSIEDLRTDENLIRYIEKNNPQTLRIVEIPDKATSWLVITDRYTDLEQVIYCLDGKIYFA